MTNETSRIEAFSDGIFSIAATLLVLELRPPAARGAFLAWDSAAVAGVCKFSLEFSLYRNYVDQSPSLVFTYPLLRRCVDGVESSVVARGRVDSLSDVVDGAGHGERSASRRSDFL